MRHLLVPALVVCAALAGCLEGDPNPLKQGSPTAITPGSSGGVSSGGSTLPTVQPGTACAQGSSAAVDVTFRNQTADHTIDLFWVDYQCTEVKYATLAPGASRAQPTFVGHPWRLRDSVTGALYKEFVTISTGAVEVTVP